MLNNKIHLTICFDNVLPQRRLCASSRLLQRWISSWITFVMLWCTLFIVYWIDHSATLHGILEFMLPLIVLGLLTSAYAEVNFEGERLIKVKTLLSTVLKKLKW